jgi:hypothetical protein
MASSIRRHDRHRVRRPHPKQATHGGSGSVPSWPANVEIPNAKGLTDGLLMLPRK